MPCPSCQSHDFWLLRRSHARCKSCRKEYSLRQEFIPGLRATKGEWRKIIGLILDDRSIRDCVTLSSQSHGTVFKMVNLIRHVMTSDLPTVFEDLVETDETYMGPKWHNRRYTDRGVTRRGRGTDNPAVFGIICPKTDQVFACTVRGIRAEFLIPIIQNRVRKGTTIYTDTSTSYRRLRQLGYPHKTVDHQSGEYVRGLVTTNHIEGFWGWLKRRHKVCGGIRHDRLELFVGSWTWIYNHRKISKKEQIDLIMKLLSLQT